MHSLAIGLGLLIGVAVDADGGRTAPFWIMIGLSALAVATFPCVLMRLRWIRGGCGLASVAPDAPRTGPPALSNEDLAIAALQAQLLRARDERSQLEHQIRAAASAREPPHASSPFADGTADGLDATALGRKLDALRRREQQLLERLAARRAPHMPGESSAGAPLSTTSTRGAPADTRDKPTSPQHSPHLQPLWIGGGPKPLKWTAATVGRTRTSPWPTSTHDVEHAVARSPSLLA